MAHVRASMIVLNYQGEKVVGPCIDSLLASCGPDDEIIVVDNASTDGSRDVIRSRDAVRLVESATNTYIFGLNLGLEVARGEFVAFLNNDMTVDETFVDRCVQTFDGREDVFAVCPRILQLDGQDQGSRTAGRWHRGLLFYEPLPHVDEVTDCFFAVGGQSFFRRSMLDEIGSIDPLLWPMYHEDIELSYRAWKRGWRVVYAPDAIAHHLGGFSSKKVFTATQLRSFVRQNELLTVWKDVTDRRLIVEHLLMLLPRLLTAIVKRDWGTVRGYGRAVLRAPRAVRARRAARAHMTLSDAAVIARVSLIR